jgi:hypothetical protein
VRAGDLLRECYKRLNVSAITSQLSQNYTSLPAIYQRGRVPRTAAGDAQFFPYITFHLPNDSDWSTKDELGGEATLQIDVWTRSGSALTAADIARLVLLQTVRAEWDMSGFIACERESVAIMDDPDGLTKRAMVRLRLLYLG